MIFTGVEEALEPPENTARVVSFTDDTPESCPVAKSPKSVALPVVAIVI